MEQQRPIKVGDRVLVALPDCGTVVGTGVVTFVAERTEVELDNGSAGMFPNDFIRPMQEN
jgi:hypothetical protein